MKTSLEDKIRTHLEASMTNCLPRAIWNDSSKSCMNRNKKIGNGERSVP